jgi:hypothetical protein
MITLSKSSSFAFYQRSSYRQNISYGRRWSSEAVNSSNNEYKIYLVAGESSGDLIGAKLIRGLKLLAAKENYNLKFYGVGGYDPYEMKSSIQFSLCCRE